MTLLRRWFFGQPAAGIETVEPGPAGRVNLAAGPRDAQARKSDSNGVTMAEGARWTMGQAGRAAGVTRKAIRVYEARGLLSATTRTAAGYRLFSDADVDTLRFIRRARGLGLGLDDVTEVLVQRRSGGSPCSSVRTRLIERADEVDAAIGELQVLRAGLLEAAARCVPDPGPRDICPIIDGEQPQAGW